MPNRLPEPWLSFLREVDQALEAVVELHCLGGFVLSVLEGLPRPTGDVDFIAVRPLPVGETLLRIAGKGTLLAKKYNLYLQHVTIADYPSEYESRLIDITPAGFRHLRLKALETHDVVLAKLSRNSPRDRDDVRFLVKKGVLDRSKLEERFEKELRPYLQNEKRVLQAFELWLDEFFGNEEQ